jgi:hypothetical protein
MTPEYFVRLAAGHAYSYNILRYLLGQQPLANDKSLSERLFDLYRNRNLPAVDKAIQAAMRDARDESLRDLERMKGETV